MSAAENSSSSVYAQELSEFSVSHGIILFLFFFILLLTCYKPIIKTKSTGSSCKPLQGKF